MTSGSHVQFCEQSISARGALHDKWDKDAHVKCKTTALLDARSDAQQTCTHCGKCYDSNSCFKMYAHLASPNLYNNGKNKALIGKELDSSSTDFCLLVI